MEIQLIKYSPANNSAMLITDNEVTEISIVDCNGNNYDVVSFSSIESIVGYITTFRTLNSNLTFGVNINPDFSTLSVIKITDINADSADAAMYDSSLFSVTKIDMLNAIKDSKNTKFYKSLVKFTFLELAMNDIAKYSGNIEDTLNFYNEMVSVKNMFKSKYHYYEKL